MNFFILATISFVFAGLFIVIGNNVKDNKSAEVAYNTSIGFSVISIMCLLTEFVVWIGN